MPQPAMKRSPPKFVTQVFQMPKNLEKRQAFIAGLEALMKSNGVKCTASSLQDEISKMEALSQHVPDHIVEEIEVRFENLSMPLVRQQAVPSIN